MSIHITIHEGIRIAAASPLGFLAGVVLPYCIVHTNRPDSLRAYRWMVKGSGTTTPEADTHAGPVGGLHPVLRAILRNRGLTGPADIQAFLEGRYVAQRDPYLLADMDAAVARISQAIERNEIIVVYGDFDADGVTSTVLLTEALRGFVDDRRLIRPYIPDRVDEGYGLNSEALTKLREQGASLVISVDCGIRSPAEVAHAASIGLDMIISDHHSLGPVLPAAAAVINPNRPDCTYPEKKLAGVGIAFKIAQALRQAMPDRCRTDEQDLLDLVAIGTVADLAPLLGENRKLVIEGLEVLNKAGRPGVAALLAVCGIQPGRVTAESIGFGLGPRINAAGRLAHAYDAAKLLAAPESRSAMQLAASLNTLNKERQTLTAEQGAHAETLVDYSLPILIASDPGFRSGIVGLVASRLAEKAYRPTIIMEQGESESRGSCRSIPEFHITKALDQVADLLERHGGHSQAAGFTIRNEHIPAFIDRMSSIASEQLAGKDLRPQIEIDAEIDLGQIDWALHESLAQLEPTGYGNPSPRFVSRGAEVISSRAIGSDGTHLQLDLRRAGGRGNLFRAVAFRQGDWHGRLPDQIDIVYSIKVNEWNGSRTLQLQIEDINPTETNDAIVYITAAAEDEG